MAKVKTKNEPKVEEPKPGTAVAVVNLNANLPAFLQEYKGPRGTENIDQGDVTIPRIKVGQGTSKEVKEGRVEEGDQFINVSGEIVAKSGEKLPFIIVAQTKEVILWRPREDNGGGILARARPTIINGQKVYAWDKPNTEFKVKVKGVAPATWKTGKTVEEDRLGDWGSELGFNKDGTPVDKDSGIAATAHHNYIVLLPTKGNMVAAISLDRSKTKKAKDLNAMLKMGTAPMFARVFTCETFADKSPKGPYANVIFSGAGFVDEATFAITRELFKGFQGREINVDQSDGGDHVDADDRA